MGRVRVTYTKSSIGYSQRQKETIRSLGLRRMHGTVELPDTASVRGMIAKVNHLVRVEELPDSDGGLVHETT